VIKALPRRHVRWTFDLKAPPRRIDVDTLICTARRWDISPESADPAWHHRSLGGWVIAVKLCEWPEVSHG
jgi:hypothetical protein